MLYFVSDPKSELPPSCSYSACFTRRYDGRSQPLNDNSCCFHASGRFCISKVRLHLSGQPARITVSSASISMAHPLLITAENGTLHRGLLAWLGVTQERFMFVLPLLVLYTCRRLATIPPGNDAGDNPHTCCRCKCLVATPANSTKASGALLSGVSASNPAPSSPQPNVPCVLPPNSPPGSTGCVTPTYGKKRICE